MSILDDLAASAVNAPVTGLPQSPAGTTGTGGFFDNLLTGIGNLPLSGLAQTGLSYAALDNIMDRLGGVGSALSTGAQRIGEEAAAGAAFIPFTVSTGFGDVATTPEGGFTTSLSPAQAAQQQQLQAITSGLLGGMGGMGVNYARQPPVDEQERRNAVQDYLSFYKRDHIQPVTLGPKALELQARLAGQPSGGLIGGMGGMGVDYARQPGDPGYVTGGPVPLPPMTAFQTSMSPEEAMAARISGAQPPQAPMAPATGGFGAGIPDVSGITTQALGDVTGVLTGLAAPMGQREADVYERIRAVQRPEEQRRQLALQEQLQAQGRTGLRTAQFGGSPEQFAFAQAQEEAKNRAALSALGQAQAEQQQQLGLAQGLFGLGSGAAALPASLQQGQLGNIGASLGLQYLPEQQLLNALSPAINLANIAGTGQRQGAGYLAEAGISGLGTQAQTELARANLLGQIYSSILGAAGATGAAEASAGSTNDLIGSIFGGETLGGLFSSIFGGGGNN